MAEQRVNTAASISQNIYAQPSVTVEGSVVPGMGRLGRYQSQLLLHNDSESEPEFDQQHQPHPHQRSYLPPFYASGDVSDISAHTVANGNQIPLATYHRNHRNNRKS